MGVGLVETESRHNLEKLKKKIIIKVQQQQSTSEFFIAPSDTSAVAACRSRCNSAIMMIFDLFGVAG